MFGVSYKKKGDGKCQCLTTQEDNERANWTFGREFRGTLLRERAAWEEERGCLRRNERKKHKDLGTVPEEESHSLSQVACWVGTQVPPVVFNHPCFPLRWKENPGNLNISKP